MNIEQRSPIFPFPVRYFIILDWRRYCTFTFTFTHNEFTINEIPLIFNQRFVTGIRKIFSS